MAQFDPTHHPHRRFNPLTNEYILVSPQRSKRPWLGQVEPSQPTDLLQFDPKCYLCPGNFRAGGEKTEKYEHTYTFENDYAAILPPPVPAPPPVSHPLLTIQPVSGGCDVLIFHPRHDLTIPRLTLEDISRIIEEWIRIYRKRGAEEGIKHVQIFENKGSIMGCSNPHPHGQVWSMSSIPTLPSVEIASLIRYSQTEQPPSDAPKGPDDHPCLLCEYAFTEAKLGERVVVKNQHWVALVPWWATWPFEILLLPYHRHIPSIFHLTPEENLSFASIISKITIRYDNLFLCSFAYSMGIHQRPVPLASPEDTDEHDVCHLHLHFDPPLLRSASVKKFIAGIELMAEVQRDLTPEQAAERLRACSETHYLDKGSEHRGIH
ncbi:galactose-1-phosphate uridyl transferase [Dendrothele bispora CBS 962.96]|uniref:Galactose-1-phosphate uridylyltransferase n=1 Tax=Dendrothele bispora (strain CBS 962.96) TaxID=1314807 RepID=A0A4V4HIW4_DENBC|nr:galactose-1-phosphate uridyl transferase [Dendrothele bispora CBS 962.96]